MLLFLMSLTVLILTMVAVPLIWKHCRKKVVEVGANVGIANDGDADRCLAVDENGEALMVTKSC